MDLYIYVKVVIFLHMNYRLSITILKKKSKLFGMSKNTLLGLLSICAFVNISVSADLMPE